jgi:7,8-dihydropterin-6-yl-methyl-4-(beta-D-ribofuranosyl)aminobenzene 5'-phosphate synthase
MGRICLTMMAIILTFFSLRCDYAWAQPMDKDTCQIIIIYDNNTLKKDLISAWGFSCLINLPRYIILFDTGGDPSILLKNMDKMDIDPRKIDSVVLSHIHGDHVGGLTALLGIQKRPVTVYLPKSFPDNYKKEASLMGADVKEVGGSVMIHSGVYTTGELGGSIKEQSLVLKTSKGLVIITGCAHPGIVEIVSHVKKLFKDNIYLLIGGFHLIGKSQEEITSIVKKLDELNVKMVAPCHCSGDTARNLFKRHYGNNYIECGAGLIFDIPDIKE